MDWQREWWNCSNVHNVSVFVFLLRGLGGINDTKCFAEASLMSVLNDWYRVSGGRNRRIIFVILIPVVNVPCPSRLPVPLLFPSLSAHLHSSPHRNGERRRDWCVQVRGSQMPWLYKALMMGHLHHRRYRGWPGVGGAVVPAFFFK